MVLAQVIHIFLIILYLNLKVRFKTALYKAFNEAIGICKHETKRTISYPSFPTACDRGFLNIKTNKIIKNDKNKEEMNETLKYFLNSSLEEKSC